MSEHSCQARLMLDWPELFCVPVLEMSGSEIYATGGIVCGLHCGSGWLAKSCIIYDHANHINTAASGI